MAQDRPSESTNVVLVHGAFVDGSSWQGVHTILRRDGYSAVIVQPPMLSLAGDVAATKRAVASRQSPVLLVGHCYGGVVITEAGHDPRVTGLIYVTGLVPDQGESAASLIQHPPYPRPRDGVLVLDESAFPTLFAADLTPEKLAFLAASQVPWGLEAANARVGEPAWKSKPSWYLLAADGRMIPPSAQRFMARRAGATLVEAAGSHLIYVSKPIVVAALIEKVAAELSAPQERNGK